MRKFGAIVAMLVMAMLQTAVSGAVREPRVTHYGEADGLSSFNVVGAVQDRNGLLWFATWNGLNCYDGYEFHLIKTEPGDGSTISTDHLRQLMLGDDGNLLCRTDGGVYEFNLDTFTFRDIAPERSRRALPLMQARWEGITDSQGNRWARDSRGLTKVQADFYRASMLPATEGLHPRSFLIDRDSRLWVGTRSDRKLRRYAPDGTVDRELTMPGAPYCLFQASDGEIWIGCKPGPLVRLSDGAQIQVDPVYDIAEDSKGRLWLATFGGGVRCIPHPREATPPVTPSVGGTYIKKVVITPSQHIVAASLEGLLTGAIDQSSAALTRLSSITRRGDDAASLASNSTISLGMDSHGNIYVATECSGVDVVTEESLLSPHPQFIHLNRRNSALPGDVCNALRVVSDSLVLIVGNDNVTAFNPLTRHADNYGPAFWGDTCRFAETTPLPLPDGGWLLGAYAGAYVARPGDAAGAAPPIVFTTLSVNDSTPRFCLPGKERIELRKGERNLTLGFAAVDLAENNGIRYRSSVDGSPWTDIGATRTLTLFNLDPGWHTVSVQSTDRYGRRVDNSRSLKIYVPPFWHETLWARIIFILAGMLAVAAAAWVWIYVRRVNRQRRELLEKYLALINADTDAPAEPAPEPTAPADTSPAMSTDDEAFLQRVRRYVEENIGNSDAGVDDMAAAAAVSRSTLNRRLKSMLGVSASQLLAEARMTHAESLLADGTLTMAQVADRCGYADVQYFKRVYRAKHPAAV